MLQAVEQARAIRFQLMLRTLFPCLGDNYAVPTTVQQGRDMGIRLRKSWTTSPNLGRIIGENEKQIISCMMFLGKDIARAIILELSKARLALRRSKWFFDLMNTLRERVGLGLFKPANYGYSA